MKGFMLTICLLLGLAHFAFAEDCISLGKVDIELGDLKAEILAEVEEFYRIQEDSASPGSFFVFDRKSSRMIGTITFADNSVFSVSKSWGVFDEAGGLEIMKALIGAIASLAHRTAYVSLQRMNDPQLTMEAIKLSSGTRDIREIEIIFTEQRGHVSIHVSEHLHRKSTP
jgi:hypothetical protein